VKNDIKWWLRDHEFGVFVLVMIILTLVFSVWFAVNIDKPSKRVRHYECYSGGVLVIDQDYRLSKGNLLIDESGERVSLKNLDCVVTR